MAAPTSHDVARLAGVSQPTVSRALRDDTQVSEPTRRLVRDAAQRLGYVPSRRGRSLSTQATGQLAVVVGDLENPFFTEAIAHLHAQIDAAGYRVVILTATPGGAPDVAALVDGSFDGAVLTTTAIGEHLPAELARRGLPVVLLNRASGNPAVDACVSENAAGAATVAAELVALGHRRIGAVFGPSTLSTGREREAGFRAALAERGRALPADRVAHGPFSVEAGDAGLVALLAARRPPTAIFCANDVIAIGALNAARRLGLQVPRDLTIIGFDDIAMAAWPVFALTTMRQDLPAMVDAAVDLLLARIADPDLPHRQITVPARIVHRATHGTPGGRL